MKKQRNEVNYDLFRRFLEAEGCRDSFDRNFEAYHPGYVVDRGILELIGIDCGIFGRIFKWDDTPEGRAYWKFIADKWFRIATNQVAFS